MWPSRPRARGCRFMANPHSVPVGTADKRAPSEAMRKLVRALTRAAAIGAQNQQNRQTSVGDDVESGDLHNV